MNKTGTRLQVMYGNAKQTSGGLKKKDLKYNKNGKIVRKKMSIIAMKKLQKAGYTLVNEQIRTVSTKNMEGRGLLNGWNMRKKREKYLKMSRDKMRRDKNNVYNNLLDVLEPCSKNELNDTKWIDRIINTFLSEINGLLDWFGWGLYMFNFIQVKSKIKGEIHISSDKKFCGLFGTNITYSVEDVEPHAFIIFKDSDSTDKYLFNGRGQIYVNQKDICDIRDDLEKKHSVFEGVNIYKPITAIQTRLDGLVIHNNGTRTKKKTYRGLCFPICVVYAYMFLNTDSTFKEIDNFLLTKTNGDLETLFLKMNNKLGIHD